MKFDPARTALLAMDFQGTILGSLGETDALLERVRSAIAAMRRAGGKVAYIRVAFTPDDLAGFPDFSAMGQRMRGLGEKVLANAPETQVDNRIAPEPGDIVCRKSRVGPFGTTDLDAQLRAAGVDTLVIAGIHTSGCVLSSVRDAHDRDYRIIVLADCCADPDPVVHEFLVGSIFPKQAEVGNLADFLTALEGTDRG